MMKYRKEILKLINQLDTFKWAIGLIILVFIAVLNWLKDDIGDIRQDVEEIREVRKVRKDIKEIREYVQENQGLLYCLINEKIVLSAQVPDIPCHLSLRISLHNSDLDYP